MLGQKRKMFSWTSSSLATGCEALPFNRPSSAAVLRVGEGEDTLRDAGDFLRDLVLDMVGDGSGGVDVVL
jgi:hypothetical protein